MRDAVRPSSSGQSITTYPPIIRLIVRNSSPSRNRHGSVQLSLSIIPKSCLSLSIVLKSCSHITPQLWLVSDQLLRGTFFGTLLLPCCWFGHCGENNICRLFVPAGRLTDNTVTPGFG